MINGCDDKGNYKQNGYHTKHIKFEKEQACMKNFQFGIDHLTIGSVLAIANGSLQAILSGEAIKKINTSHQHVQRIVQSGESVYGINTGFGALANKKISEDDTRL